jgi:rfaE bifunctional protein, domain II
MAEIMSIAQIARESKRLHDAGKRVVATNGCFDLLHVGHVRYLAAARKLGDALVVGLNSDDSVRELKGDDRPFNSEQDRAEVLAALRSVDYVVIFPGLRATQFLVAAHPDIYVKGGDYAAETLNEDERRALQQMGTEIRIVPFENGYSTSGLIEKIERGV